MSIFKTLMLAALAASPVLCTENPAEVAVHFDEKNRDLSLLNWSITFLPDEMVTNFTLGSVEEIILKYNIQPKNASYSSTLYTEDCKSNITNLTIVPSDSLDPTSGLLTVGYDLNKSQIAGSNIWNASTNQMVVCEEVLVLLADGNGGFMSMQENRRILTIDFDLNVEYNISGVGLAPETIGANETDSDVDSYVKSCQCSESSYACTTDPIAPNEKIYLCIYSKAAAVGIDDIYSMTIDQTSAKTIGTGTVAVITGGVIDYPQITSETECAAGACGDDEFGNAIKGEGVKVSTFIPINEFDFTTGTTVSASGTVNMNFESVSGRKLSDGAGRKLQGTEPASFAMEVTLTSEEATPQDSINSASAAGKGITGLAFMYAIATAMW